MAWDSSTLERFALVQRLLLQRSVESPERTPRMLLTPVLPRRRLRHAQLVLLDLTAGLRTREWIGQDRCPDPEDLADRAPDSRVEMTLQAAAVAGELAFVCGHPEAPGPDHIRDFLERLQGRPSALVPATAREHAIESLWHLGGITSALQWGWAERVHREALLAAGHLVLIAEITGGIDQVLARLDSADDEVTLPEITRHG